MFTTYSVPVLQASACKAYLALYTAAHRMQMALCNIQVQRVTEEPLSALERSLQVWQERVPLLPGA